MKNPTWRLIPNFSDSLLSWLARLLIFVWFHLYRGWEVPRLLMFISFCFCRGVHVFYCLFLFLEGWNPCLRGGFSYYYSLLILIHNTLTGSILEGHLLEEIWARLIPQHEEDPN